MLVARRRTECHSFDRIFAPIARLLSHACLEAACRVKGRFLIIATKYCFSKHDDTKSKRTYAVSPVDTHCTSLLENCHRARCLSVPEIVFTFE